jgi:hypothetical protein
MADSEIREHRLSVLPDRDVWRLDVSMNDRALVGSVERTV